MSVLGLAKYWDVGALFRAHCDIMCENHHVINVTVRCYVMNSVYCHKVSECARHFSN